MNAALIPVADQPLTPAQRIAAAASRARAAHGDQELHASVDCPAQGAPAGIPPHAGNCAKCGADPAKKSHSLMRSPEAEDEVALFYEQIRAAGQLGGVPVADLDEKKGNMIGVLLCADGQGHTQVLRAFSGFIDESGVSVAPGCCPMIPPPDPAAVAALEAQEAQVEGQITTAKDNAGVALQAYQEAKKQVAAQVEAKQQQISAIYKGPGTKPQKDAAAAQLKADKAAIEATYAPQKTAYEQATAPIPPLEAQRDALRASITSKYSSERLLTNFANEPTTQQQACNDARFVQDGRTGNCAAPKMIAEAQRRGWTPVAVAEIWIGKEQGSQKDFEQGGTYVPSCECCRSILGFSLCGLAEKQQAAGAK